MTLNTPVAAGSGVVLFGFSAIMYREESVQRCTRLVNYTQQSISRYYHIHLFYKDPKIIVSQSEFIDLILSAKHRLFLQTLWNYYN